METHKKITVTGVLSEGIGLGIKNAVSMLGATVLWLLTIWIPYLNVGTTIAMNTIPIELSKGKVISLYSSSTGNTVSTWGNISP